MFRRKNAFTLAEVLITLGIIGVVAAMTVPTLVGQTGEQEYKTGLKKAVSTINQAVQLNYVQDGSDFSLLSSSTKNAASSDNLFGLFSLRLNVQNNAVTAADFANGSKGSLAGDNMILLNDGSILAFDNSTSCTTAGSCTVWVDTNGYKLPNAASQKTTKTDSNLVKDQFKLYIYNQTVVPADDAAKYLLYH
ncbi:MAG: type II secretion system GspH family protein [bacterium]|nr:type II secretion system GspH family protein [bacterium]